MLYPLPYLSSVQGDCQNKDSGHDDGYEVEGHHRDRPPVPALEHLGVAQLYEEDVDHAHCPQQQGLYCNWKT